MRQSFERGEIKTLADILTAARSKLAGDVVGVKIEKKRGYVSGRDNLFDDPRASPLHAVAQGLLPPCCIVGAGADTWCLPDSLTLAQGSVGRRKPLRAARDGSHATRVHADERA